MNNQSITSTSIPLLTADEGLHDMTLALLYLSRISSFKDPAHYWDVTNYRASTTFDKKVLAWLNEVGYINNSSSSHNNLNHTHNNTNTRKNPNTQNNHEVILTSDGVYRAREILAKLGIQDWDKAEILGRENHENHDGRKG